MKLTTFKIKKIEFLFCFCMILMLTPYSIVICQCQEDGSQDCQYGSGGDDQSDPDELASNGNFSNGNKGFESQYGYSNAFASLKDGGSTAKFGVGFDAAFFHLSPGLDHTNPCSGTGSFLAANGPIDQLQTSAPSQSLAFKYVWRQSIPVLPNNNYKFSFWLTGLGSLPRANIGVVINGVGIGGTDAPDIGAWIPFNVSWNSGSSTLATIDIIDFVNSNIGNNFGLDDISFKRIPTTTFNAKLILEGHYNSKTDKLDINDTVKAYLRSISPPYSIVDFSQSILDAEGNGTFNFHNAGNGTEFYLAIRHRNSIETWSKEPVNIVSGDIPGYDFTSSSSLALGENQILVGKRWCIFSGDVNQDGVIDATDISLIYNDANSSVTGYVSTDLNGDSIVDGVDILICENNAKNFVMAVTTPQISTIKAEFEKDKVEADRDRKDKSSRKNK